MKRFVPFFLFLIACSTTQDAITSKSYPKESIEQVSAPYISQGWTDDEAADYLIDKFTFGHIKGLKAEILNKGINNWLTQQLNPVVDKVLESSVSTNFPATAMTMQEIAETYPGLIVTIRTVAMSNRMSGMDGLGVQINFNEMFGTTLRHVQNVDRLWFYEMENGQPLEEPMKRLELGNFMDLMYQMAAQKLYRATYSENQLEEKLVDFWFNHFNVSITRINDVATNVLSYERDAIRPHIYGNFEDMLAAIAQHPAMLTYLDNTISNAAENVPTLSVRNTQVEGRNSRQKPGINENFARELLELHTLGVDGGYTQKDVEEVARILTGWKTSPLLYPISDKIEEWIKRRATDDGISFIENGFYFDASRHDATSKKVLGKNYVQGQGENEGIQLFKQLTNHPSTSKHIAKKIITYFVNDTPEQELIHTIQKAFAESNGNLKVTLRAMVEAPDFWDKKYKKSKAKSPFEYVASSLRKSDATVKDATVLLQWISKMGQPLYGFQPPTGYPTNQEFWVNEAAIAQRIKFSRLLINGEVKGVEVISVDNLEGLATLFVSPQFQKR